MEVLKKNHPPSPEAERKQNRSSRALILWVTAATTILLPACDSAEQINAAIEALKSREKKITVREEAAIERERGYVERERRIAAATADLERQKEELEKLRATLETEIARTKRERDALLLRERRGPAPSVAAERMMVIDPHTGEVLAEKNADKRAPVASTQKLLTALLVLEEGGLDQMVTIAKEDSNCAPVKIYMSEGDRYTRRQLLTALMVRSFNNIARALARDNAGSYEAFAEKMNERAKQLGMTDSRFVNPNGLPAEEQYSTARDMATLARAADALPELRSIVSLRNYVWQRPDGKTEQLENTNRVLRTCEFCDGMKTGYTDASGYCLVASGEKEGIRRIVVVLSATSSTVWKDAEALLEWSLKG